MNINYLASHFLASLSCGGSSKENNTYLTMTTTTNPDNLHCHYQICPLNVDICRIKLDFIVSACFFTASGHCSSFDFNYCYYFIKRQDRKFWTSMMKVSLLRMIAALGQLSWTLNKKECAFLASQKVKRLLKKS